MSVNSRILNRRASRRRRSVRGGGSTHTNINFSHGKKKANLTYKKLSPDDSSTLKNDIEDIQNSINQNEIYIIEFEKLISQKEKLIRSLRGKLEILKMHEREKNSLKIRNEQTEL